VYFNSPANQTPAKPTGPAYPPGYDRAKAASTAAGVAKHLNEWNAKGKDAKYNYSRAIVSAWQKAAGIVSDGIYGRGTYAALKHFGASPPKPFFAQGVESYPWS
jgi:murein L,D-transpeptidase YcbB/YkuD